jgi:hypothetical protein
MTQTTAPSQTAAPGHGPRPAPAFDVTYPASIERFHLPPSEYLRQNYPPNTYNGIDTRVLVFDAHNRVLLLRREQDRSWEPPGGAMDEEDGSLCLACTRQLEKASGLITRRIVRLVSERKVEAPGIVLPDQTAEGERAVVRISFEVEIASYGDGGEDRDGRGPAIMLNVNEHDAFIWASEAVVLVGGVEEIGVGLGFSDDGTRELILDGFRRRREIGGEEATVRFGTGGTA